MLLYIYSQKQTQKFINGDKKMNSDKIRVVIAEDGTDLQDMIETELNATGKFEVVGKTSDGNSVVELVSRLNPDLLILDIILTGKDGFTILEETSKLKGKTKTIVLSALSQQVFIEKAINLGASYYMLKPFNVSTLTKRCEEVANSNVEINIFNNIATDLSTILPKSTKSQAKALEEKITNLFITVGIPAHIKGYSFLREAIKMAVDNPDIINSITKKLYPSIAERFQTSASKVERAIRHAIEVAWNRGKIENINQLFGIKVYTSNDKPTNGEFIALVADKMLLEGA